MWTFLFCFCFSSTYYIIYLSTQIITRCHNFHYNFTNIVYIPKILQHTTIILRYCIVSITIYNNKLICSIREREIKTSSKPYVRWNVLRKYIIYSGSCVKRCIHRKRVYNSDEGIPPRIKVIKRSKINILDGL